jgi:transcriptional regulator with XRE-family HTH domain
MSLKIGSKIKEVFDSKQIKLKDFANNIGIARQNIYRIFEKDSIDTDLLTKISTELNHDFFQYFRNDNSSEAIDASLTLEHTEKLEKLNNELKNYKNELKLAKKEIDYLKKIIDLMEDRTKLLLNKKELKKNGGV